MSDTILEKHISFPFDKDAFLMKSTKSSDSYLIMGNIHKR